MEGRLAALFTAHWLSPTQRRIVRYLVEHPAEGTFLSSIELAGRVGVSQASVTRLAAAMGLEGYAQLQAQLRAALLPPAPRGEGVANKYQAAVREEVRALNALDVALADPAAVDELGQALAGSAPLVVLGLRLSAPVAEYFGYQAAKIHPDVRVATQGGSQALDGLCQARQARGEWVLAFLLPRCPREMVPLLQYAHQVGLRVAAVGPALPAALREHCDRFLPAGVGRQLVFDSHAAPFVLATVLLEALGDGARDRTQARLEEYERVVTDASVYLGE